MVSMNVAILLSVLAAATSVTHKAVDAGVAVELSVTGAQAPMKEGDDVVVGLRVSDSKTGAPMTGVRPSLWMTRRTGKAEVDNRPCGAKIAAVSSGSLFSAADVDLNIYYVVALNTDDTLTVVDPRFEFGGSHLLAVVQLSGRGEDWALSADQRRLFVSIPASNRVAVVSTNSWKVERELDAGANPSDLEPQPDGKYIWVTTGAGATAIDASTLKVAAKIDTGRGPHRIALTSDSRTAFVTNAGEGTVSLIDVGRLARASDVPAGKQPVAIAWSARSEMAFAAGADGIITVIDARRGRAVARIASEPGIHDLRITRDGRWGFVLNGEKNLIELLDAASSRIVQRGIVDGGPEQVGFTDTLAYITQYRSDQVLMATLATVGEKGKPLALADFPGGDNAPGKIARSNLPGGIAAAPGESAVVVANPADGEIYYYKEGMAAPMGRFSNYNHQPAAVMAFDRSMREEKPGSFATRTRLARGGVYDVALYIDAPRVVQCFELTVAPNDQLERERQFGRIAVQYLDRPQVVPQGRDTTLRFRLFDVRANQERPGLRDVAALVVQAPGIWRTRERAVAREDGTYELDVNPPNAGVYYVYIESPTLQLRLANPQYLVFDAQ